MIKITNEINAHKHFGQYSDKSHQAYLTDITNNLLDNHIDQKAWSNIEWDCHMKQMLTAKYCNNFILRCFNSFLVDVGKMELKCE